MRQLITEFPLPIYSIISTIMFVSMFIAVLIWTFKLQPKEVMEERALIPFHDDETLPSQSGAEK